FKTEPDAFSIDDLKNAQNQTTLWEGVRNYQARNFMRDEVKVGDLVMIYHSSCKLVGVVGIAVVTKAAYPDPTQFDLS
ncbi:EVE domain-containing protein, partial [Psychrobacter sp. TB20-MNA-CIBAN-0197]